jgi:hypothetical protein
MWPAGGTGGDGDTGAWGDGDALAATDGDGFGGGGDGDAACGGDGVGTGGGGDGNGHGAGLAVPLPSHLQCVFCASKNASDDLVAFVSVCAAASHALSPPHAPTSAARNASVHASLSKPHEE